MTTLSVVGPATIHAGESLSDAVDCTGSLRIARVIMPPEWDNADLTFQVSPDGTAWHDLYNVTIPAGSGTADAYRTFQAVVFKPRAGSIIVVPAGFGVDVSWLKVRSGTAIVPVVQSADREFSFVVEMPDVAPVPARRARGWAGKRGRVRLAQHAGSTVAAWPAGGRIVITPPGPTGYP
jgi:hypothetical protein